MPSCPLFQEDCSEEKAASLAGTVPCARGQQGATQTKHSPSGGWGAGGLGHDCPVYWG